jgi:hypothetical protein
MRNCTTLALVLSLSACGRTTVPRDPNVPDFVTREPRAAPTRAAVIEPAPESSIEPAPAPAPPPAPATVPAPVVPVLELEAEIEPIRSITSTAPDDAPPVAPAMVEPTRLPTRAPVMPKKLHPQSRAYVRWDAEDERERVRSRDEYDPRIDRLTAEGITVREKLERAKKAEAIVKKMREDKAAQAKLKAKHSPPQPAAPPQTAPTRASVAPTKPAPDATKAAPSKPVSKPTRAAP